MDVVYSSVLVNYRHIVLLIYVSKNDKEIQVSIILHYIFVSM